MTTTPEPPTWEDLQGQMVVLDVSSPFVYLGRLVQQQGEFLVLEDVDAHDLRDTPTITREQYILDCRRHGIHVNRARAWVNCREIVAVSRLADVVVC